MQVEGAGVRITRHLAARRDRTVEETDEGAAGRPRLVSEDGWDGPERRRRRRRNTGRHGGRRATDLREPGGVVIDVDHDVDIVVARQAALARQATLQRQTVSRRDVRAVYLD